MERLKDALSFPMRLAGAFVRIGGRITVGSVGFLLMGAGLLLISPFGMPYLGIPVFLAGLLLLARAVF
jgi:hypothetical protein